MVNRISPRKTRVKKLFRENPPELWPIGLSVVETLVTISMSVRQTQNKNGNETMTSNAIIQNALVEVFGYDESISLRSVVESSPRYATLVAMAGNDALYGKLKKALAKVAKNPKTRASF